jgi:hypothetical protein
MELFEILSCLTLPLKALRRGRVTGENNIKRQLLRKLNSNPDEKHNLRS